MRSSLKFFRAPTLLAIALVALAACETVPARPPVSPGSTEPRVDPDPGQPSTTEPVVESPRSGNDGGLTPPFLSGQDLKRAAVLLPFSHPNAQVRNEAESMLAGIELALFELGGEDMLVMPFDTEGSPSVAEARADEAIQQGADVILGPLFGANVAGVRRSADRGNIPIISFSNDRKVAGAGVYLASIMPEEEVSRVMGYAYTKGVRTFVFLGPDSDYGRQIDNAMRSEAGKLGASVVGSAFYDPKGNATEQAKQIATLIKSQPASAGAVGVMVPERGLKMLSIAPLFPVNGVDMSKVRLLGTSLWDDSSIWRESVLQGAIFASTDPADLLEFQSNYKRIYGRAPTGLSAVAYDAAAVAVRLAGEDNLRYNGVTDPDGFLGVNGLFRFRVDGTTERGLTIKQISTAGPVILEAAPRSFTGNF